jgi:NADH-quinone oxidoreductase subunit F
MVAITSPNETEIRRVIVCAGTGCVANGAYNILEALVRQVKESGLDVLVEFRTEQHQNQVALTKSGCQGFCQMGPLVTILPENILYTRVKPADIAEIVGETLVKRRLVERLLYTDPATGRHCPGIEQIPFY